MKYDIKNLKCRRESKEKRSRHLTLKKTTKPQGNRLSEEERNSEELQNNQKTINKMTISTYFLIISLNVNVMNFPI